MAAAGVPVRRALVARGFRGRPSLWVIFPKILWRLRTAVRGGSTKIRFNGRVRVSAWSPRLFLPRRVASLRRLGAFSRYDRSAKMASLPSCEMRVACPRRSVVRRYPARDWSRPVGTSNGVEACIGPATTTRTNDDRSVGREKSRQQSRCDFRAIKIKHTAHVLGARSEGPLSLAAEMNEAR